MHRADGVGCVRGFAGPMKAVRRQRITRRRRPRKTTLRCALNAQRSTDLGDPQRPTHARQRRVRGANGKERSRLKTLPPPVRCRRSYTFGPRCALPPPQRRPPQMSGPGDNSIAPRSWLWSSESPVCRNTSSRATASGIHSWLPAQRSFLHVQSGELAAASRTGHITAGLVYV